MIPTFAAKCQRLQHSASSTPAAIDRYLLPTEHSAANLPATATAADRWDRRMPNQYTDPTLHTMWTVLICNTHDIRLLDAQNIGKFLGKVIFSNVFF